MNFNKYQGLGDYTPQYTEEWCLPSHLTPPLLKLANTPMILGRQHKNHKWPLCILMSLNTLHHKLTF